MAPAEKLIWDPTYWALGVSVKDALEQVFGADLSSEHLHHRPREVRLFRQIVELMHLFDLLDERSKEDRLGLIRNFHEVIDGELVAA